jgi:ankyrin repeat protein
MKLLLTTIAAVVLATIAFAGPIHDSAANSDLTGVQAELDKGVDVNAKDEFGRTPLHYAATKEIAELLIAKGADVNAKDMPGFTPLHRAARFSRYEIAKLLISKGADVNARDDDGFTPLHEAAYSFTGGRGPIRTVELLISKGANVNSKGESGGTPLDIANGWGHEPAIAILRKHGGKTGAELKTEGK